MGIAPLGILSQVPTPEEKLLPSGRGRKLPPDSAHFRTTPVTIPVTAWGSSGSPESPAPESNAPPHGTTDSSTQLNPITSPERPLQDKICAEARAIQSPPKLERQWRQGPPLIDAPLGKNTEILSDAAQSRMARRDARFELREVLQDVSSIPRTRTCGVCRIRTASNPELKRQALEDGSMVAHFAHVMLCGLIWVCPVCGPKIRQQRAVDLDTACTRWMEEHGTGSVMLLTLTVPHDFGEPLGDLLKTVRESFTSLIAGRAWQDDKLDFGLLHWVRAHDVTVGGNGWHPHLHIVLFSRSALRPSKLVDLEDRLYCRWVRVITNHGNRRPSRQHGIRLEQARSREEAARYVCQVVTGTEERPVPMAMEVTRGDLKTSSHAGQRTPWQVLGDVAKLGDCVDLRLWHEWEQATQRVQAIRWSNGLRKAVGLGKEESDAEIVEAVIGGEVVYTFTELEWRALCRKRGARARVLRLAETGGELAVRRYMDGLKAANPTIWPSAGAA